MRPYQGVTERFLRYVQIDTQSDPDSPTCPSTEKQKDLSRLLVEELRSLGIQELELDENGYVYAYIPSNSPKTNVPSICFCSHVDTSPDCSGTNVKPQVHTNYAGGPIYFSADAALVLDPEKHPALKDQIGNDIITADGTTLLGADNKSGVAEIMEAARYIMTHPEFIHGPVSILFTPDEEIGRGVDKVNLAKVKAEFGYTMDGETLGHIENETFSADMAVIRFKGVTAHPGYAKGLMQSAIKAASAFIDSLPKDSHSPETTEAKQGFVHPVSMGGTIEEVVVKLIIRSFEQEELQQLGQMLSELAKKQEQYFPGLSVGCSIVEQYRNMKTVLDHYPHITEYALEAVRRTGVTPLLTSIRGGTDGSRLSFMGLPCPNIYAGEHAFHSKLEWVSSQDMEKATATIIHLLQIAEERA
jgi:tripeptide aminopeptidase